MSDLALWRLMAAMAVVPAAQLASLETRQAPYLVRQGQGEPGSVPSFETQVTPPQNDRGFRLLWSSLAWLSRTRGNCGPLSMGPQHWTAPVVDKVAGDALTGDDQGH